MKKSLKPWVTFPFAVVIFVTFALFWVLFERKRFTLWEFFDLVLNLDEL